MQAGLSTCTLDDFEKILSSFHGAVPNADEYRHLTTLIVDIPDAGALRALDPFSSEYYQGVLNLYLVLRARADADYVPTRDEAPSAPVPTNVWSDLTPWCFHDPTSVGEHLYAWGHIMHHLALKPGNSVLEYGPGSGQLLLMLARMGFRACGVDVDAFALEGIRLQAKGMGLDVPTECALFGEGFQDEQFDTILFYEAFHHAIDFQVLLHRLHDRLKPGGRIILCGEPIVPEASPGIPYLWGPRLDALSIFCMRRFGWMELGFTHTFFMDAVRRAGWTPSFYSFDGCGRAYVYVLEQSTLINLQQSQRKVEELGPASDLNAIRAELEAVYSSTSWRFTKPLRFASRLLKRQ